MIYIRNCVRNFLCNLKNFKYLQMPIAIGCEEIESRRNMPTLYQKVFSTIDSFQEQIPIVYTLKEILGPKTPPKPTAPATTKRPVAPTTTAKPVLPATTKQPVVPPTTAKPLAPATTKRPVAPPTTARPVVPATTKRPAAAPTTARPIAPATTK